MNFICDFSIIFFSWQITDKLYVLKGKNYLWECHYTFRAIGYLNKLRPKGSRTPATIVRVIWLSTVNVKNGENSSYWTLKSMFHHINLIIWLSLLDKRAIQVFAKPLTSKSTSREKYVVCHNKSFFVCLFAVFALPYIFFQSFNTQKMPVLNKSFSHCRKIKREILQQNPHISNCKE